MLGVRHQWNGLSRQSTSHRIIHLTSRSSLSTSRVWRSTPKDIQETPPDQYVTAGKRDDAALSTDNEVISKLHDGYRHEVYTKPDSYKDLNYPNFRFHVSFKANAAAEAAILKHEANKKLKGKTDDLNLDPFAPKPRGSGFGRLGRIETPHGVIETPNFIFCGTKAAIKCMTPDQLRDTGAQIMLSNTFHLMIAPGPEVVESLGGLQKMTGWKGPMLTDSGGYQIFSMGHGSVSSEIKGNRFSKKSSSDNKEAMNSQEEDTSTRASTLVRITEDGALFRSYVNGKQILLSPEYSMEVQRKLGADLIVMFDECTPFHVSKEYTRQSMYRSHRWGDRSLKAFKEHHNDTQAMYGIIQGGVYPDLRQTSADYVNSRPFFGQAIGGSLGSSRPEMHRIVRMTRRLLREDRPVHLLGIGGVRDIFHGVRQGIDTFDCVHPTRLGRHGSVLVRSAVWDQSVWWMNPEDHNIQTYSRLAEVAIVLEKESSNLVAQYDLNGQMTVETLFQTENFIQKAIKRLETMKPRHMDGNSVFEERRNKLLKQFQRLSLRLQDIRKVLMDSRDTTTNMDDGKLSLDEAQRRAEDRLEETIESIKKTLNETCNILQKTFSKYTDKKSSETTVREHISLNRADFKMDPRPIDDACNCYTCRNFSRGYIQHLLRAGEALGPTLCTIHNAHFMNDLMSEIRKGIETNTLDEVEATFVHPSLLDPEEDSLDMTINQSS